jgi:hypothetical protein
MTDRARITFPIPPGAPAKPCRSCGARIFWITTPVRVFESWTGATRRTTGGKRMPVDPNGESHFATCPQHQQWRRP